MENALGGSDATTPEAGSPAPVEINDSGLLPERDAPEAVTKETVKPELGESEQEEKPEKTFTQKELDDIIQKRLDKANRRSDKKLSDLNTQIKELAAAQKAIPVPETGKKGDAPKRADFELYEDYLEARTDYTTKQGLAEEIAKLRAERDEEKTTGKKNEAEIKFKQQAETRISEGRKEYPDFDSVINDAFKEGVIELNSEMYYGIVDSDMGHRIAYFLAQNPAEADRISELSPRGIQRELGKLEVKLATKEKVKPDTMEPLGGARAVKQSDAMRADISMDEFVRLRNQAERKSRGL